MITKFKLWLHKYFCFYEYEGIADCDDAGCIYEYKCVLCGDTKYKMYRGAR